MAQHFLLSAASRSLSLRTIYTAGEDAAYQTFCNMRWPEAHGEAVCLQFNHDEAYRSREKTTKEATTLTKA